MQGVPGFYQDNGGHWTMAFYQKTAGILIPAIGFDGMLQGFQIKLDIPLKNKDDPRKSREQNISGFRLPQKRAGQDRAARYIWQEIHLPVSFM